jgi:hypothetical protein
MRGARSERGPETTMMRSSPRATRACAWLASQPDAPDGIDPSGTTSVGAMIGGYVATRGEFPGPVSAGGMSTIVAGAWEYLCSDVRDNKTAPTGAEDD